MTIGRVGIRPPPGCRFIQGIPDMLIEFPREQAAEVIQWFKDWIHEFEFHVASDVLAAEKRAAQSPVISQDRAIAEAARVARNAELLAAGILKVREAAVPQPKDHECVVCLHAESKHAKDGPCSVQTCTCQACVVDHTPEIVVEAAPTQIPTQIKTALSNNGRTYGPQKGEVVAIGTPIPGMHWENGLLIRDARPQVQGKTQVTPIVQAQSQVPVHGQEQVEEPVQDTGPTGG